MAIYLLTCLSPDEQNIYYKERNECLTRTQWKQPYTKCSSCLSCTFQPVAGQSWTWSYGSWIYKYLCNQCLSPLTLWDRIPLRWGILDTTLCDCVCKWLAAGRWFSPCTLVSSTNKSDRHDITEILLKVALNTITKPNQTKPNNKYRLSYKLCHNCNKYYNRELSAKVCHS